MQNIKTQEDKRIQTVDTEFKNALSALKNQTYKDNLIKLFTDNRETKKRNNSKKVAIVGLGPTGIIASLEAYANGFNVVALEARKEYTREQAFRFPVSTFNEWLKDYFGVSNLEELSDDHPIKQIAKLEIFAKRKTRIDEGILFGSESELETEHIEIATRHLEEMFYTLVELISENDPDNFKVMRCYEFDSYLDESRKIKIIPSQYSDDTNAKQIIINDVDYVLGCDGLNSKTREKAGIGVNYLTEKKEYIAAVLYQDTKTSTRPGFVEPFDSIKDDSFLSVQNDILRVRKRLLPPIPEKQAKEHKSGAFHQIPAVRVFFTAIGTYLGFEYVRVGNQDIEAKCKFILRAIFGVFDKNSKFLGFKQCQQHLLRNAQIFNFHLQNAKNKHKKLENGVIYIPLGDAHANAHFQTGSGALFGINSARGVIPHLGTDKEKEEVIHLLDSMAIDLQKKVIDFTDVNLEVKSGSSQSSDKQDCDIKNEGQENLDNTKNTNSPQQESKINDERQAAAIDVYNTMKGILEAKTIDDIDTGTLNKEDSLFQYLKALLDRKDKRNVTETQRSLLSEEGSKRITSFLDRKDKRNVTETQRSLLSEEGSKRITSFEKSKNQTESIGAPVTKPNRKECKKNSPDKHQETSSNDTDDSSSMSKKLFLSSFLSLFFLLCMIALDIALKFNLISQIAQFPILSPWLQALTIANIIFGTFAVVFFVAGLCFYTSDKKSKNITQTNTKITKLKLPGSSDIIGTVHTRSNSPKRACQQSKKNHQDLKKNSLNTLKCAPSKNV